MTIVYDPQLYRSPQRVWDADLGQFKDLWRTTTEFVAYLCDGTRITVPEGFEYDKASVPRLVWWYIPRDHRQTTIAALVHDYLYETQITSREVADKTFYDLLLMGGMRKTKAWAAYMGVRAGGWRPWGKHEKELKKMAKATGV